MREMRNERRYAKLQEAVKCEGLFVNVADLIRERAQRIRIRDSIFEDEPQIIGSECVDKFLSNQVSLEIPETTPSITLDRVGVDIFSSSNAGKEFNEESLHLKLTQSKSARTINHPIYRMSRTDLHNCILKGHLKYNFRNRAISNSILEYVFYLMACHSSTHMIEACYGTLEHHLQNSPTVEGKHECWTPSIQDITSVFMNFGTSKELLTSYQVPLPRSLTSNRTNRGICPPIQMRENFCWVIKYIFSVLSNNKNQYEAEVLDKLLLIVVNASLDKVMTRNGTVNINMELFQCIRRIYKSYSITTREETGKVANLSNNLHSKIRSLCASDYYFLCNFYLGSTSFGKKIHHALTHCFIKSALNPANSISYLDEVDVDDIRRILKPYSLLNVDYFTQYYIILNVDRMITSLSFTSNRKRKLAKLRQLVSNLKIKAPHSEDMIDYFLVKQLITTVCTAWKMGILEEC